MMQVGCVERCYNHRRPCHILVTRPVYFQFHYTFSIHVNSSVVILFGIFIRVGSSAPRPGPIHLLTRHTI